MSNWNWMIVFYQFDGRGDTEVGCPAGKLMISVLARVGGGLWARIRRLSVKVRIRPGMLIPPVSQLPYLVLSLAVVSILRVSVIHLQPHHAELQSFVVIIVVRRSTKMMNLISKTEPKPIVNKNHIFSFTSDKLSFSALSAAGGGTTSLT